MPPQNLEPDTAWEIVAPGVIALPTTQYRIEANQGGGMAAYLIFWRGQIIETRATLDYAKMRAREHMRDMLAMGYER